MSLAGLREAWLPRMNRAIQNMDADKFLEHANVMMENGKSVEDCAKSLGFSETEYRFLRNVSRKIVSSKKESKT